MTDITWLVETFVRYAGTPEETRKFLLQGFSEELVDQAYEEFRKKAGIKKYISPPPMLVKSKEREDGWYVGGDGFPDAKYWPALKNYLLLEKKWPKEAVQSINDASDKIVSWLESPWAARIQTRGLVVGYVQSGKTANFTAVIAKAADANYRFFIILAGTKKSLQSQTQQRLEKELISLNTDAWFSPTNQGDFKPMGNANYFLSDKKHDKVFCVIKKNKTRLNYLIDWLKSASPDVLRKCPFLIIDDEADEASVNTAPGQANMLPGAEERTTINGLLVKLLKLLPKAAYIGYTATPFANIFIDPSSFEDLYPGDFIVSLPKPKGHFGTEQIFGRSRLLDDETDEEYRGLDMLRFVPDNELTLLKPAKSTSSFSPQITNSLAEALRYFWMACSARAFRNQSSDFSTMLIHISERIPTHNAMREEVEVYRRKFLDELQTQNQTLITMIEKEWNNECFRVPSKEFGESSITFDQLKPQLISVVEKTEVVIDNSKSTYRLSFEQPGKIQIAIGGNTLSRGLTLEGLIVSYFIRTARTYDTLLQMGRWFGYRPGYDDLPRIWMTKELLNYFKELATIEAEMRRNIEVYDLQGVTPRQFGIKVRTNQYLSITAPLKMQHAVTAQVSYSSDHVQTVLFEHKNGDWLRANIAITDNLIKKLFAEGYQPQKRNPDDPHIIFRDIPVSYVLSFVNSYGFHPNNRSLSSKLLADYIKDQNKHNLLKKWNIVIRGVTKLEKINRGTINLGGLDVPLLDRSRRSTPTEYAHIGTLMSKGDTGADLSVSVENIKGKDEHQLKEMRQTLMPDTGLLVIYPISKDSVPGNGALTKVDLDAVDHIIGLGFVFPEAKGLSLGAQSYVTVDPSKLDQSDFELEDEEGDEE